MQPSPSSETSRLLLPSLRFCIRSSFGAFSHFSRLGRWRLEGGILDAHPISDIRKYDFLPRETMSRVREACTLWPSLFMKCPVLNQFKGRIRTKAAVRGWSNSVQARSSKRRRRVYEEIFPKSGLELPRSWLGCRF